MPSEPRYQPAVSRGYPRLRARGQELVRRGVSFLDASQIFARVEVELYYDACHFVQRGQRLLAEAIAPAFLATLPRDAAGLRQARARR